MLERTPQEVREKVKVVTKQTKESKKSLSYYKVLEEINYKNETFSLVEVEIKTGVTHQIRVHMKHLGHSIVGDKMYGNSTINRQFEKQLNRQFLHASHIEFEYNKEKHKFDIPLTEDLQNFLEFLK